MEEGRVSEEQKEEKEKQLPKLQTLCSLSCLSKQLVASWKRYIITPIELGISMGAAEEEKGMEVQYLPCLWFMSASLPEICIFRISKSLYRPVGNCFKVR